MSSPPAQTQSPIDDFLATVLLEMQLFIITADCRKIEYTGQCVIARFEPISVQ